MIEFAPRLHIERSIGDTVARTGYGGYLMLSNAAQDSLATYHIKLDVERSGDERRMAVDVSYKQPIIGDIGTLTTGFRVDSTNRFAAQMGLDFVF